MNGEKPLSPELLTERLTQVGADVEEIKADVKEIRKVQQEQASTCARNCASNEAVVKALAFRVTVVEGDVAENRRRINAWGTGNTVIAAIFAAIASLLGDGSK